MNMKSRNCLWQHHTVVSGLDALLPIMWLSNHWLHTWFACFAEAGRTFLQLWSPFWYHHLYRDSGSQDDMGMQLYTWQEAIPLSFCKLCCSVWLHHSFTCAFWKGLNKIYSWSAMNLNTVSVLISHRSLLNFKMICLHFLSQDECISGSVKKFNENRVFSYDWCDLLKSRSPYCFQ